MINSGGDVPAFGAVSTQDSLRQQLGQNEVQEPGSQKVWVGISPAHIGGGGRRVCNETHEHQDNDRVLEDRLLPGETVTV